MVRSAVRINPDNIMSGAPRLLWAEAIDEYYTALVVECHGELLGGVAALSSFDITFRGNYYETHHSSYLTMKFFMAGFRVVKSREDFWQSREYAQARQKKLPEAQNVLQIEAPPKMIGHTGDSDG